MDVCGSLTMGGLAIRAPLIGAAVGELRSLRAELEHLFARMAEELPPLAAAARQQAAALQEFSSREAGAHAGRIERAAKTVFGVLEQEVQRVDVLNSRVAESLKAIASLAEELSAEATNIGAQSSRLGLTAVNTSTLAVRAQQAGRVLGALSRELGELTRACAAEASDSVASCESIRGELNGLLAVHGATGGALAALIKEATEIRVTLSAEIPAQLRGMSQALATASESFERIHSGVRRAMVTLQREDLVRQGLEQIGGCLEELERAFCEATARAATGAQEFGARDYLEFQAQVGEVVDRMMREVERDLEQLMVELRAGVGGIQEVSPPAEEVSTGEVTGAISFGPVLIRLRDLLGRLEEPARALPRYRESATHLRRMADRLGHSLAGMGDLTRRIRMVNSLLAMETARESAVVGTLSIASEIGRAVDGLCAAAARAGAVSRCLSERIAVLAEATSAFAASSERARPSRLALGEQVSIMTEAAALFSRRLEHLARDNQSLQLSLQRPHRRIQQAASVMAERVARSEIAPSVHACSAQLVSDARRLRPSVEAPGPAGPSSAASNARMAALVARFTRLGDKEIAGQVAGLSVEEGDRGGELTLF